jgi:L-fucose mutarotase/ribose pyranase (RbsD/FucU family)
LPAQSSSDWKAVFQSRLALYGHRNWIVVSDSAFPAFSKPGVETVVANEGLSSVLKYVESAISTSRHVRATAFVDKELQFIDENDFPGVSELRRQIRVAFTKTPDSSMLHAKLMSQVDEAGETYRVLFIKTTETIPYTTVFLRLDCGYLDDAGERKIRSAMASAEAKH